LTITIPFSFLPSFSTPPISLPTLSPLLSPSVTPPHFLQPLPYTTLLISLRRCYDTCNAMDNQRIIQHIQNVDLQNVDLQNVESQNIENKTSNDKTSTVIKCRHHKTSTSQNVDTTKRRHLTILLAKNLQRKPFKKNIF
jgi:hypothetical protein